MAAASSRGATGLLASRIASSDDPITHRVVRREHRHRGRLARPVPDRHVARRDAGAGDDPPRARVGGVSRSGRCRSRATGSRSLGSWVWDCDHYRPNGEKTEFHPVPRRVGRSATRSSRRRRARAARPRATSTSRPRRPRRDSRRSARTRRRAPTSSRRARTRVAELAERQRLLRLHAVRAGAARRRRAARRWRVVDRGSVNAPTVSVTPARRLRSTCASPSPAAQGARVVVAKQIYLGWTTGDEGRPPSAALRPAARPAGDGPVVRPRPADVQVRQPSRRCSARSRPRPASGSCTGASTGSGDAGRARSPRATARRSPAGRASTSTSSRASRGRSSRSPASATSARCPSFDGPGPHDPAVPAARARSATRAATTIRARSRPRTARRALGRHVVERLDGRLDLPAVEHPRLLPADVHGQPRAADGKDWT